MLNSRFALSLRNDLPAMQWADAERGQARFVWLSPLWRRFMSCCCIWGAP